MSLEGYGRDESVADVIYSVANFNTSNVEELVQSLLEAIRSKLGMDVGFISKFVNERREFLYVSSRGSQLVPEVGNSDPLEETACFRVTTLRAPNLVPDAQSHPSLSDLPTIKELGVTTHASVPIPSKGGEAFGTLCCYAYEEKEELDERDIGFMSVIADLIGASFQEQQRLSDQITLRRKVLREVMDSGKLEMVWQPIVNPKSGQFVAVESLARFKTDPYRPPNEWFEEAQTLGLATDLELRAFEKGLAVQQYLPRHTYVGCNLSGTTFLDPQFQDFLKRQDLKRIVVEITEHDAIADYSELVASLSEFRKMGMRLAIDDFGAGYAGFRHLVELDPDIIKLDMLLVRNIDRRKTNQRMVSALVKFSQEQDISLVAEGVETQAELDMLTSLGIEKVQGYLFHRPSDLQHISSLFGRSKKDY